MPESLSRGFEADVYHSTPNERLLFPQAEITRVQLKREAAPHLRRYYELKIAHLLFPKNFINVVATVDYYPFRNHHGLSQITHGLLTHTVGHRFFLFSKEAAVAQNHAVFTEHALGKRKIPKISNCSCNDCTSHRQIHNFAFETRAAQMAFDLARRGIHVARNILAPVDITDVCLGENGGVVFFEVDHIDPLTVRELIAGIPNPNEAVLLASKLIQRYERLPR